LNEHEKSLAARRRELVERSNAQRIALAASVEPLVRKTAAFDRVVTYVRSNPAITAVAVGAFALIGPRKIFDMATRAITIYALFRR
jgi:hypothetical protein